MENEESKKKATRVGYVAADAEQKVFESGKKVTNLTILTGSGDDKKATYVRGWNAMADRLQNIKKGEKWEFRGDLTTEKNGDRSFDVLNARESYPHIKMEVQGEVKDIIEKHLGKTKMTNVLMVSSEMEGGKSVSNIYNIELYGERNQVKAKDIKIGDVVSTQGHVRMYEYVKDGEAKLIRSFQNPYEIKNHTRSQVQEEKKEEKKDKTMEGKKDETKGKKKSAGKKMEM